MKIRTRKLAPIALAATLALGAAACEGDDTVDNEVQDVEDATSDAVDETEDEMDEELVDESESGDDMTDDGNGSEDTDG